MLKTERMSRVLVMGTMDALHETVDYLYQSRLFHIIDFKKDDTHDIGTPLPGANEASGKLLKMMSVSSSLDIQEDNVPDTERLSVDQVNKELDAALSHLELEISAEIHARKEIEDLLAKKRNALALISPFCGINYSLGLLGGYSSVAVLSGRLKGDPEGELKSITDSYEIISKNDIFILVISKQFEEEAMKILAGHGFTELKIPHTDELPSAAIETLNREIKALEGKLREVSGKLEKLKEGNAHFIAAALENLTIVANKGETPLRFGTARYTFLIDAWVPTKSLADLRTGLGKIESGAVDLVPVKLDEDNSPPILMNNPRSIAPMQMLLEMFSLPSYDEIDPTFFMFITFPLFYGLMLGDVGYGVVLLILVLSGGLTKLMTKLGMAGGAPGLNKILLYCSITSIIFGFLFNELFGFEIFALHEAGEITVIFTDIYYPVFIIPKILAWGPIHFPILRGNTEMVGTMLIFCVWLGVAHLMLGYLAGFRNVWVKHGLKHAILEKGGWCLILAGFTLFAFSAMPKLISGAGLQFTDPQALVGLGLLAAGVAMAFTVEGMNAVLELPSMSGNLLSYTRIYAIGLSSIGIAMAFNEYMAMPAIESGGIGILIGIAVLVGGHAMNLALGVIGPLIQTLRLHYVEFFTKFYKGGGLKFNPLKYIRKHTKEV
jgi:V/A-type H+-transporting ATPase subunit I